MRVRSIRAWTPALFVLALGCNGGTIGLPNAADVNRIEVHALDGHTMIQHHEVHEQSSIRPVVQFLMERNNGWGQPFGTSPAPKCSFALYRDSELLLVVWMGAGWIGARKGEGVARDNRFRDTPEVDVDKLAGLIGLDPGRCSRW